MNREPLPTALGQVIRSRRQALGLSQEDLADKCGLHRTYIGSVERGERNITLNNVSRIGAALGASPSEMLGEAEGLLRGEKGEFAGE